MKERNSHKNITPCFIVGIGRSGTTLLTNMLNGHESISAAPENNFILFGEPLRKITSQTTLIQEFNLMTKLKHNHTYSIWEPDISKLDISDTLNYSSICKWVYCHSTQDKNPESIRVFVDKNPIYSLYIKKILKIFPDARFIVLTRDYRDNILSRKKYTEGFISRFIVSLAAAWNHYYAKILKAKAKDENRFHLIRYEDLVKDPSVELSSICSFLNLDFQESMLNTLHSSLLDRFDKTNAPESVKTKIHEMHNRLSKPIDSERVNYWVGKFSRREILIQEKLCNRLGDKFGYLRTQAPNFITQIGVIAEIIIIYPLFRATLFIYYLPYYHFPWKLKKWWFKLKNGI